MNKISIVIPIFNEVQNINKLLALIEKELNKITYSYEIIFVNDGSSDESLSTLNNLMKRNKDIKIINFTKNFGQTAAMDAGIKAATKDLIITMDGDMQNDPSDIPILLKKLKEGYDVVCGWRKNRKDPFEKKLFSFLANSLRKFLTGEKIHDSGCSMRIYKREVFKDIDLYGEMHRFIPAILLLKGYNIGEVVIKHKPRQYGISKYGALRLYKGILDLLFITFLLKYSTRPLHIFGALGFFSFILGFVISLYLTYLKILYQETLSNRPLLILAVLLIIIGTQYIIFGILAEILMRIYYKTHSMKPYSIKDQKYL